MTRSEAIEWLELMSRCQLADITPAQCAELARLLREMEPKPKVEPEPYILDRGGMP